MSYLLTEVALEMLGYKFYDMEGNPLQINFRNNGTAEPTPNEPTLLELFGLGGDDDFDDLMPRPEPNTAGDMENGSPEQETNISCDIGSDVIANSAALSPSDQALLAAHSDDAVVSVEMPVAPVNNVLLKLMDINYEKVCGEMHRNKALFIKENMDTANPVEAHGVQPSVELLQSYISSECENLQKEVKTLLNFRQLVENRLVSIDPAVYEKYKTAFKDNQDAIYEIGKWRAKKNSE